MNSHQSRASELQKRAHLDVVSDRPRRFCLGLELLKGVGMITNPANIRAQAPKHTGPLPRVPLGLMVTQLLVLLSKSDPVAFCLSYRERDRNLQLDFGQRLLRQVLSSHAADSWHDCVPQGDVHSCALISICAEETNLAVLHACRRGDDGISRGNDADAYSLQYAIRRCTATRTTARIRSVAEPMTGTHL
jgi:hypothetical protein